MDEPQPVLVCIMGRTQLDRLPIDPRRSTIRRVVTRQDLDQRGFARSVLTQQAVNLASTQVQGHPIECALPLEGLRQTFHDQLRVGSHRRHRGVHLTFRCSRSRAASTCAKPSCRCPDSSRDPTD